MYRFSSGLKYSGTSEKGVAYLIFQSEGEVGNRYFDQENWKYLGERPKGTRAYTSNFYGRIELFKKPLSNQKAEFLFNALDGIQPEEKHPALLHGFKAEAQRLLSTVAKEVVQQYEGFIDFLNEVFELEVHTQKDKDFKTFSDDIGPFAIGKIGQRDFVLPEFPTLYLAPALWREINWYINNYLSGPYPDDPEHPNLERFHWNKLKLPTEFNSTYHEGVAYFLIANFILIYEAFSENKKGETLQFYIDLIQNQGLRPWQQLF